jgi:squalene-hopene/tetraprenyl-beta-curcumene cyclase
MSIDQASVKQTLATARAQLLAARWHPEGDGSARLHWEGELSASALSTATSVCALAMVDRSEGQARFCELVDRGFEWLAAHQNGDGGWGDTVDSPSNISTTTLCWAALGLDPRVARMHGSALERTEAWLMGKAGDLSPPSLARAIGLVYGEDRTFSTPILTMCALTGRFGSGRAAWRHIPSLPFELAACPHAWLRRLGLPVVSYALPALIAIGQARHFCRPTRNPLTRCLRNLTRGRTLGVLESIQPSSGGFLEAAPLTGFVTMSLVSIGQVRHPVVARAVEFLSASVRPDGSWPIDTDLATWLTTLSVMALATGNGGTGSAELEKEHPTGLSREERTTLRAWLLGQQYEEEHPYTRAAPGGWAWTDLTGGVPDADDTAGALLALWQLADKDGPDRSIDPDVLRAVSAGVCWLLDLQNRDGGIPTFCRGWGKLPFDRSSPDLTAHALRAWDTWRHALDAGITERIQRATDSAIRFLIDIQCSDGSWVPLWFGNQYAPRQENPLYGTTRVLKAARIVPSHFPSRAAWRLAMGRSVDWLLNAQNADGGWGGAPSVASSIEETAMALEALAEFVDVPAHQRAPGRTPDGTGCSANSIPKAPPERVGAAINHGVRWLEDRTKGGTHFEPSPIGLYFAKLWYAERLYPLIWTVSALERVCQRLAVGRVRD